MTNCIIHAHTAMKTYLRPGNYKQQKFNLTQSSTWLGMPQETNNYGKMGSSHLLYKEAEERREREEGITGARRSETVTKKIGIIHGTTVFKILDIRQQRRVIS